MAVIALIDRADLISIMVPLEVIVKNYKHYICICFCMKHELDFEAKIKVQSGVEDGRKAAIRRR